MLKYLSSITLCSSTQLICYAVEKLLRCILQDGWTPLHLAVQARRTDVVRLLLIKKADRTLKNHVLFSLPLS